MTSLEIYLLHDETLDLSSLSELASDYNLVLVPWQQRETLSSDIRVLLYLSEEQIKELLFWQSKNNGKLVFYHTRKLNMQHAPWESKGT